MLTRNERTPLLLTEKEETLITLPISAHLHEDTKGEEEAPKEVPIATTEIKEEEAP